MITALKIGLLVAYLVAVFWLSIVGMRKTKSLRAFAVGNKDMGPVLVGVVMASSIASTATFVINPGFVYTHGLSAFLHYAVAAQAGIAFGLVVVTKGFRRLGETHKCLTIPHWLDARYGSRGLSLAFAVLSLLSITFVVLIMVGCALLVQALCGIGYVAALVSVLVVVFGYVLLGGTYAHAYTNAVQAGLMAIVAVLLFASGLDTFEPGFSSALSSVSADYAAPINPSSSLYDSVFAVFVSAFVVTFALMLQPHVLTKVLYLRGESDVRRFLITTVVTGAVFSLVLTVGFYARLRGIDLPLAQQDQVVPTYVLSAFGDTLLGQSLSTVVLVALLAAGMSTLDGILVALATMVTHDLYLRVRPGAEANALRASRWVLVAVGLSAFVVALDPPKLVGIFAQQGVYGLAAASFVPILFGVLVPGRVSARIVGAAAGIALATHLLLNLVLGVENPAVSSCWAIMASCMIALAAMFLRPQSAADPVSGGAAPDRRRDA